MSLVTYVVGIVLVLFALANTIYGIVYCTKRSKEVKDKNSSYEGEMLFTILFFVVTTVLLGLMGVPLLLGL